MAEKNFTNTSSVETNAFIKGMVKDPNASFVQKENWTHARNTVNNSVDGDVAVIGNEPSNIQCASVPYPIIGAIHTYRDQWVIFATDDVNSEIGLFDDSECKYTTLINAPCLNFNRKHLITGAAKENFDCTWQVYWDDGNNPSRTLNINKIPYIRFIVSAPGADCVEYADTTELDCEKIRLAPLLTTPCVKLTKASDGGQLRNGSYQAFIAYTVNGQRQTDYIGVSNVQSLFDHNDLAGSLHINVTNLDKEFDYYELVILSNNTQNTVAKRIGLYSTEQSDITIDYIDQALVSVPLEVLPLRSPAYEKSDQMYTVNDWLIRSGPTEQFDFNYQPLANQIQANWVVAEYPENYYYKGGNKTGFMRDEQYAFFIRWIYNTGERSSSYHIPGRGPRVVGQNQFGDFIDETAINIGQNSLSPDEYNFQVFNTATQTAGPLNIPTDDGGVIIAKGDMAYWESTERYPATRPDIWNANNNPAAPWATSGNPQHDLCGKPIRHHKMPSEETSPLLVIHNTTNKTIRILGVEFSNIALPRFNDGSIIPNIVGYELLRGSREGQKSILAKGIFRNMRTYAIPNAENDTSLTLTGLYPNYPYNDLRPDVYFHNGANNKTRTDGCHDFSESKSKYPPITGFRQDVFTFHGPDLMFKRPFLSAYETRLYGALHGDAVGYFIKSENHPQNKLLRNAGVLMAGIIGIGYAISQIQGTASETSESPSSMISSASSAGALWLTGNGGATTPPGIPGSPIPGFNNFVSPNPSVQTGYITAGTTALTGLINSSLQVDQKAPSLFDGNASNVSSFAASVNANSLAGLTPGLIGGKYNLQYTYNTPTSSLPQLLKSAFGFLILSVTNIAIGAQEIIDLLYNLVAFGDFAYKHNSHGLYSEYAKTLDQNTIYRSKNTDSNYIGSSFQGFGASYKINNLFRPGTVAVETQNSFSIPEVFTSLPIKDISRYTIGGDADSDFGDTFMRDPGQKQKKKISALYGALKFGFENQYGQLDGIKQVQMRGCIELVETNNPLKKYTSQSIFSGDTYVGRYTEKTIMPIFTDFLYGQPDQYPYDYLKRVNIPYPRFWMDTRKYDTSALGRAIMSLGLSQLGNVGTLLPNDLFYLDRGPGTCGDIIAQITSTNNLNSAFAMRTAYMYTHCSGIQDFYVESEINLAQRDWEDDPRYRHYDPYEYNNVDDLFNAAIIRDGNFYKYDYSLSVSRFLTNLSSFGNLQLPDYDPLVAEKCYSYYPKRLIYSLQAQLEAKKDFWRVFLPNNYKDFKSKVNVIKPINKSGAIIFFPYLSPQMFQGLDTLETDLGTKLTIGDGGLFSQPFQNVANSDLPNEYGSCESSRSVINTPFGLFFISQAQGKVFQYTGNLVNIANAGMKWWFNKYLPSVLVRQFPELEDSKLSDNPVIGIGCQAIYDINDDIVYFTKKDYAVREEYLNIMSYDPVTQKFLLNSTTVVPLGDPIFFENCSWTVSYDPKANAWISFHDWHPDLVLPSIRHFLTAKTQATSQPQCPPNYNYNPVTGKCERTQQITERAPVVVDEVARIFEVVPMAPCLLDIILAVDTSSSGGGPASPTGLAQRRFVQEFIDNPVIQAGLSASMIQIGVVSFSSALQQVSMNPGGFSMSKNITSAQADTWLLSPGIWYNGTEDLPGGMAFAQTRINAKASSQLNSPTRPTDPNFKQVIIMISDFTNPGPAGYGCAYQSDIFGPPSTGPTDQYVFTIFCRDTYPGNPTIVTAATENTNCFKTYYNESAYGDMLPAINYAADQVAIRLCGTQTNKCSCPPGYTMVYKDYSTQQFTSPYGLCEPEYESLCRKVTCNCPPPPFPGSITTQSGVCDNIYQIGDVNYINPDPVICKYYNLQQTPPSYTLGTLWRHNDRCDSYSNFYGISYPWEVEFTETTGQNVNTLRSIEYQLECYVYKGDLINECGDDRWHDLDWNFDEAIIYNTEQVSGLLRLELNPKDDPFGMMQYPIIGPSDIRILFSKEEQKYRFNQFWDITKDRGEFTSAQDRIFFTQLNGYIRDLNAANMNYQKPSDQRKKFRHYYNRVILRRQNSENRKMLLKLANTKLNLSFR